MKNIIATAIEIESTGLEYFQSLIHKCSYNEGVKSILNMLAVEQKTQLGLLEAWQKDGKPDFPGSDFFISSRNIFYQFKARINEFSCDIDHLALYRFAQDIQKRSLQSYEEALSQVSDPGFVAFLNQLIIRKRKQLILLGNIIDLLLRPEQWVESPEFGRLEDY
ncbi:MAG: hypothetical protein PHI68_02955 [Candidatus Cloacimonetes bacterium]|nr:hypothetical protein [Candidatus Cloacimonadota bacterium]